MIKEAAEKTPEGQWVRVIGGWSPFQFEERRMPTIAELNEVAPNTPVYVLYLYSEGYLNKKAVEVRGLTTTTPAPPGTRYEFTPEGGCILRAEPNPNLLYGSIGVLPPMSARQQAISTTYYYRDLNRFGLTSVIDAGGGGHTFPEDYAGSTALADEGVLPIRISKYLFPQKPGSELQEFEQWTNDWEVNVNRARDQRNAYVLRGGGEFLAWASGDFENFLAPRPDITTRKDWDVQLMGVLRHLLENEWPLRIHATYDESINNVLDVFEQGHALEVAAGRKGFAGIRWAIDHGETIQPATLQRIKALGGGMAMQARMTYAAEYFLERYGEAATRRAPPFRDVINAGLPLGLGSDATRVASYNPWWVLYWAITGRSAGHTLLHGPEHMMSREEALFYMTAGSAWFSQEELFKGRLKAGQYADVAILNAPFLTVSDRDIMDIEADVTIMGGNIVYGTGEYASEMAELEPLEPSWSPVHTYGGFQKG